MNTIRQAVREYLAMRRSLGFKLRKPARVCSISPRSCTGTAPATSPRR